MRLRQLAIPDIPPADFASHAYALARAATRGGDYALAEQTLTYAQQTVARSPESEPGELALVLVGLANLRYFEKRYAEAAELQSSALNILRRHLSPDHPQMIKVLLNYAKMLRKVKRVQEARQVERECTGRSWPM